MAVSDTWVKYQTPQRSPKKLHYMITDGKKDTQIYFSWRSLASLQDSDSSP